MDIFLKIISFLFGGCIASFLISWYFYKHSLKKEIENALFTQNKKWGKLIKSFIGSLEKQSLQISLRKEKDNYTYNEVYSIVESKLDEIISRRNIQTKAILDELLSELTENK